MTKPKTYGEYADQTPNVTVDIRVRDRETSSVVPDLRFVRTIYEKHRTTQNRN